MKHDTIIIGAGIVGLAAALKILEKNPDRKLLILEKEDTIAKHQTGNNSGVIHSGIYYKPGSLKAVNCRKGYKQLISFCDEQNIKYEICGKVIVAASEDQHQQLDKLFERGAANGLENLRRLSGEEVNEIEPHVNATGGIFVPQTGIIDYKDVCEKLKAIIESKGGEIIFNEKIKNIINGNDELTIESERNQYRSKYLISCAGLQSDRVAKLTESGLDIRIVPFRGEYYKLVPDKRELVKSLIYPVPDPAFPFLGVHFTRMINGEVEAGPNAVLAFKREGYSKFSFNAKDTFDTFTYPGFLKVMSKHFAMGLGEFHRSFSKDAFVKALQKLIPSITKDDLVPGGAGVRAQACDRNGGLLDDFRIIENKNIFHVCNAPSPAATSSLSIGEHIAGRLLSRIND
jgi:L-2-hydroxyglutarate oxidase